MTQSICGGYPFSHASKKENVIDASDVLNVEIFRKLR